MHRFCIIRGNDEGITFEWQNETFTIGRGVENPFRIRDTEVSRCHVTIQTENQFPLLIDRDSTNGTFLNGKPIREERLKNGDRIQIGRTLLLYEYIQDPIEEDHSPIQLNGIGETAANLSVESHVIVSCKENSDNKNLFSIDPILFDGTGSSKGEHLAQEHLETVYRVTQTVSQIHDIPLLLQKILDTIFESTPVDRGIVRLCESRTSELKTRMTRQRSSNIPCIQTVNPKFSNYVLQRGEGILLNDTQTDQTISPHNVREAICVPLQGRYGPVGIIYLDVLTKENASTPSSDKGRDKRIPTSGDHNNSISLLLSEKHLQLVCAIARQTALAIEDTQYYHAMLQSERLAAVGQTVAVLSHHIKNILQGIEGGNYLIKQGLNRHDEQMIGNGWRIVEKNQNKISDLILDMLTFSKERQPQFERLDINQTIEDIVELMIGRTTDSNTQIRFVPDPEIKKFSYDSEQIHRAITNLITNAIDAVRDLDREGIIEIHTLFSSEKKIVTITVDDNGPGIPEEEREDLFRPFFSQRKSGGTGLGLAVTAKIAHEHHGEISVAQSPLGGARFILELPFTQEMNE